MSEGTRRVFLSKSGAGAAAVGLVALTPAVAASAGPSGSPSTGAPELDTASLSGSIVAFVDDVRAGEISLLIGETEIIVQDRELVGRLLRAATS